ncbi:MAG: hypothetical protein FE78DRAFT_90578 [Acidomyces sp. 'richmondensis']|jgi:hypothetical protein|nr:MAG: hypothetical protein FE78DRAFT_90578 [Acidomyces sp. 'richmondensis']
MSEIMLRLRNIYNIDEKGFTSGKLQKSKKFFTRRLHKQDRLTAAGEYGNRQ